MRIEPTPEDAAIIDRHTERLVRWWRARLRKSEVTMSMKRQIDRSFANLVNDYIETPAIEDDGEIDF